jgi:hypothetical protein
VSLNVASERASSSQQEQPVNAPLQLLPAAQAQLKEVPLPMPQPLVQVQIVLVLPHAGYEQHVAPEKPAVTAVRTQRGGDLLTLSGF